MKIVAYASSNNNVEEESSLYTRDPSRVRCIGAWLVKRSVRQARVINTPGQRYIEGGGPLFAKATETRLKIPATLVLIRARTSWQLIYPEDPRDAPRFPGTMCHGSHPKSHRA